MSTKYSIAEQCLRIAQGGDPAGASNIKLAEVKKLVEQVLNSLLKIERYNNIREGDHYPVDLMIATYDNVAVTTYKDTAKCVLPAIPISLPRGRGVWEVSAVSTPNIPYIPLQPGQYALVKNQRILGALSGLTGYEVFGKNVVFTSDIYTAGVTAVMVKLLVIDFSTLSDTELLPIPADMESAVIKGVLEILGVYQTEDNIVNGVDDKK